MYGSFDEDEIPGSVPNEKNLSFDNSDADNSSNKSTSPMLTDSGNAVFPDEKRFSNPLADVFGPSEEKQRSEDGSILSDDSHENFTLHQAASEGDIDIVKTVIQVFERERKSSADIVNLFIDKTNKLGYTPLHLAVRYNRKQVAAYLLSKGANINFTGGEDGLTPLHLAAKYNMVSCLKLLLENDNIDVSICNKYGSTALHFAARRGNTDSCQRILEKQNRNLDSTDGGLQVNPAYDMANATDHAKSTPLHCAMLSGDEKIVRMLIQHGAKVDARDKQGEQPIHFAAAENQANLIDELAKGVTKGLDEEDAKKERKKLVNAETEEHDTALHIAAQSGYEDTVKTLVSLGANVSARTNTYSTPLHMAIVSGHLEVVKFLVRNNAKVNAVDSQQMTPMHRACQYGRMNIVKFLKENGAKVNAKDRDNFSPLLCAVWKGKNEVVEYLLDNGANIEDCDINMKTVIHLAVEEDYLGTLDLLLKRGASNLVSAPDKEQRTPLHYAALNDNEKAVAILLAKGSNVDVSDHEEKSPLHIAAEFGNLDCLRLLGEKSPGSVNATDERGKSPLHYAAMMGHVAETEELIEMGAETSARDDVNWTPLDYAARDGFHKTMKVLLEYDAPVDARDKNRITPLHHASMMGHVECIQLLLDNNASIELTDAKGKNCLDHAVENNQQEACKALISHQRWREVLNHVDEDGYHPMEKLIATAPSVAKMVLDKCKTKSNHATTDPDFCITYDFQFLDLPPSEQKGENYFGPANMVRCKREDLLSHPVTVALINFKWERFGRKLYLLSLLLYIFFVIMLTALLVIDKESSNSNSLAKNTFQEVVPWITLLLAIVQIAKECFQLFYLRWAYLKDFENYLEFILYSSTILFMMPFILENLDENLSSDNQPLTKDDKEYLDYLEDVKWNSAAICILLAWGNLLLYLKRFPFFGLYVVMFVEVLKTVLNVLLLFSICIIAFALSFFVLMDGQESFEYVGRSIIKVGVMTIGEFEYDSIFTENLNNADKLPYKVVSFLIFYLFLVMMSILLMNLLVGLAVGDIEDVQKTAYLRILQGQVDILKTIEKSYPKCVQMKHVNFLQVKPNDRSFYKRFLGWIGSYNYQSLKEKQDKKVGKEQLIHRELDNNREYIHKQKKKMKVLLDTMGHQMDVTKRIAEKLKINLD